MPAKIIDGRAVAAEVRTECRTRVQHLNERFGIVPGLAVVLVGDNPTSVVYVRNKVRACAERSKGSTAILISTEFSSSSRSRNTSD
jgi:methylenetetrahydrofolate dehydrogenase (NADP+)/methenyltetrahydrofolate cyclohydrolase